MASDTPRGSTASKPALRMSLHGPGVTIEDAMQAGLAGKELLEALTEQVAPGSDLTWEVASVQFQCDGCHLTRPDRPRSDEGWTHHDGDDFCPTCTEARNA